MSSIIDEHKSYQDAGGRPLVNGKLFIGVEGLDPKLNPEPIFSDRALTIPLANPQSLDARGKTEFKIFVAGRYSYKVENSFGTQIANVPSAGETAATGITTLTSVQGNNAITANAEPGIANLQDKRQYVFTVASTNTSTTVTLEIDGTPVTTIQDIKIGQFVVNEIVGVTFNEGSSNFEIIFPGISVTPTNSVLGLKLSNGADADHDIDVGVGTAFSFAGGSFVAPMELLSSLTKQLDEDWAVGTNQGGLDTGTVTADKGYGVYLIRRSDTGVVDVILSLDMTSTAATLTKPTNYDQHRLIGWVRTNASSNIIDFTQGGDLFILQDDLGFDINDLSLTNDTFETGTLTCPPDSLAHIKYTLQSVANPSSPRIELYLKTKGSSAPSTANNAFRGSASLTGSADGIKNFSGKGTVLVDSASQIEYASDFAISNANDSFNLTLYGCEMLSRTNP